MPKNFFAFFWLSRKPPSKCQTSTCRSVPLSGPRRTCPFTDILAFFSNAAWRVFAFAKSLLKP